MRGQNDSNNAFGGYWLWAAVGSLCVFAWAHHSAFLNPYIINDDVRQQLFWMRRWIDPALYPPELLNEYARLYVPWGVQAVYYCASFFIDPLFFSKILAGVLYVSIGTLLYLTGQGVAGRGLGFATVSVFWMMPFFLHAMSGGLARAFAGPLLTLFVLGCVRSSRMIVAVALLLQSVFIPYIFILCGATSGVLWLLRRVKITARPVFFGRLADFAVAGCAALVMLVWHLQMKGAGFGPLPTFAEMAGRSEFSAAGRFLILPVPSLFHELVVRPWEFIAPFRDQGTVVGIVGLIVILLVMTCAVRKARWCMWANQLPLLVSLAIASVTLYLAARLFLFQLFLPSRYLEYSVNVGYCLLLGTLLHGLFRANATSRKLLVVGGVLLALTIGAWRSSSIGIYDYSEQAELYRTIQRDTPKDAMVAGFPTQMDNVLTFGKRNVFTSYELAHPWNMGYWKQLEPRLRELFEAYYAERIEDVLVFCRKNNIDYLVVDDRHFTPEFMNGSPFFSPFNERIRELAARGGKYGLLSSAIPAKTAGPHIRIIEVTKIVGVYRK